MSLLIHMFFSFPCSILYCLYHKVSWTRHQLLTLFQHELTSTCADLNPTVPELVFIIRLALAKLENIYSLQACQLLSRREERGICHASPVSLSNSTSKRNHASSPVEKWVKEPTGCSNWYYTHWCPSSWKHRAGRNEAQHLYPKNMLSFFFLLSFVHF